MDTKEQAKDQNKNEELSLVIGGLFAEISPYVVQIFRREPEVEPVEEQPLATGVLAEINGKSYLLTAGHTFQGEDINQVGTIIGHDFYVFKGDLSYLSVTNSEENNNADLGVYKLLPEVADDLKQKYKFLPYERILNNHVLSEENRYFILGYPVSKSKMDRKRKTIKVSPFHYVTSGYVDFKKYHEWGYDNNINFLIEFHRSKIQKIGDARKQTAPKAEGNSGAGLWFLDDDGILRLVGILSSYDYEKSIFVASRIDMATEIIRHKFDSKIIKSELVHPHFI